MSADDVFQPLGDLVMGAVALGFFVLVAVVCVVALAFDWLHESRLLGRVAFGVMVVLVVLHFAGCATPPRPASPSDPRDPEIHRPAKPGNYPLPR
ncbi:MAG: hypothetical protein HZA93_23660 [Verrucomicrobia bacterium]|nr:hypothetical protein [Verrucomicrobiota bacterium]